MLADNNAESLGCQPPAETKIEFFFPPAGDPRNVWYDISLVDGYSLSMEIIPSKKVRSEFKRTYEHRM